MDKTIYNTAEKIVKYILWKLGNMEKENVNQMMVVWIKFIFFLVCFGIVIDLVSRFVDIILTTIVYVLFLIVPILFLWYNPTYSVPVVILFVFYLVGLIQDRKRLAK